VADRRQRTVGGLLHGPFGSAARAFGREWQDLLRVNGPDKRRAQDTKRKASPKCDRFTVGLTVVFVVHNPPSTSFTFLRGLLDGPSVASLGLIFFDVVHSLNDQRANRRSHLPGYAAWEIHPVMKLTVQ
jgi:hypothetical protein